MAVARDSAYNVLGAGVPLIVSIVTVPLYLGAVGLDRYGVLSIGWLVLGYFGLFDLGLGRATAQKIASLRDASDRDRSEVFWTAVGLNLLLGAIACLIFIPVAAFGLHSIKLSSPAMEAEVRAAIPWLAACLPVSLLTGVLGGSLEGRQRFLQINVISAIGSTSMSVLPLACAVVFGPQLWLLIATSLAARLFSTILLFGVCIKAVPVMRPVPPRRALTAQLARYGGWITVSGAIGPLLSLWDRFAIGAVLGANAVSHYTVPYNLVWQMRILPGALGGALFPRFSVADDREVARLSSEATQVLAVVMTPVIVGALIGVEPFLILWVGADFARIAAPVAHLLLVGIWTNSLASVPFAKLQAQGRPDVVAKVHVAELLPYALTLYAGMTFLGLPGVAAAWTLRCLVDTILLAALSRMPVATMRALILPFVLVCGAAAVTIVLPVDAPARWVLMALLAAASAVYALRNLPTSLVDMISAARARLLPNV